MRTSRQTTQLYSNMQNQTPKHTVKPHFHRPLAFQKKSPSFKLAKARKPNETNNIKNIGMIFQQGNIINLTLPRTQNRIRTRDPTQKNSTERTRNSKTRKNTQNRTRRKSKQSDNLDKQIGQQRSSRQWSNKSEEQKSRQTDAREQFRTRENTV